MKAAMAEANRERQARTQGGTATMSERRMGMVPKELRHEVNPNDPPGKPAGVDLTELLETMADELSMGLRYHRALFPNRPINRMIFLGGEARQTWLCQHLICELRLPAQLGDPLARLRQQESIKTPGLSLDEPQPGWAVACGLAIAPTDL